MKKVKYIGGSDQRTLSESDMTALGLEHPGLWWGAQIPYVEVEDDIADVLLSMKAEFALQPEVEDVAEELVEEKTKGQLVTEAEAMGIAVPSKANKDEIAALIAEKQQELDEQVGERIKEGQPHA